MEYILNCYYTINQLEFYIIFNDENILHKFKYNSIIMTSMKLIESITWILFNHDGIYE